MMEVMEAVTAPIVRLQMNPQYQIVVLGGLSPILEKQHVNVDGGDARGQQKLLQRKKREDAKI